MRRTPLLFAVIALAAPLAAAPAPPPAAPPVENTSPAVSPDGSRIAFLSNRDGSGLRQLTHVSAEEGQAQVPAWSADGRELAFQVSKPHLAHVWTADLATGAARKLAAHTEPCLDEVPAWFPDGKRFAFQSDRGGSIEIWVMNADGSEPRQVTR